MADSPITCGVQETLLAAEHLCDELDRILWLGEPLKWPEIRKLRDAVRVKLSRIHDPSHGVEERTVFETWAKDEGYYFDRHKDKPDEYENGATQTAWEAWKARAALAKLVAGTM